MNTSDNIIEHLGDRASFYLKHVCEKITKDELKIPQANNIDKVFANSNRNP